MSLSFVRPDIVCEWHYRKNKNLKPGQILYDDKRKVWWRCSKVPRYHKWYASVYGRTIEGYDCPKCIPTRGEKECAQVLRSIGYQFEREYSFPSIGKLRFDFYVPNLRAVIEFDGVQHFTPVRIFGGKRGYNRTRRNDKVKIRYCEQHCISILRIPYTELGNCDYCIKEFINWINSYGTVTLLWSNKLYGYLE